MRKDKLAMMWYMGSPSVKGYNVSEIVKAGLAYFEKKYALKPVVVFIYPDNQGITVDVEVVTDHEVLQDSVVIASAKDAYLVTSREE